MTEKTKAAWGNSATHIVHSNAQSDQCRRSEVLKTNQVDFPGGKEEAIAAGYRPCKSCFPEG